MWTVDNKVFGSFHCSDVALYKGVRVNLRVTVAGISRKEKAICRSDRGIHFVIRVVIRLIINL